MNFIFTKKSKYYLIIWAVIETKAVLPKMETEHSVFLLSNCPGDAGSPGRYCPEGL